MTTNLSPPDHQVAAGGSRCSGPAPRGRRAFSWRENLLACARARPAGYGLQHVPAAGWGEGPSVACAPARPPPAPAVPAQSPPRTCGRAAALSRVSFAPDLDTKQRGRPAKFPSSRGRPGALVAALPSMSMMNRFTSPRAGPGRGRTPSLGRSSGRCPTATLARHRRQRRPPRAGPTTTRPWSCTGCRRSRRRPGKCATRTCTEPV